jgi:hypothetical protein
MLAQAGVRPALIGTGLAAGALLLLGALAGLPLLALPAVLVGLEIPTGLIEAAGIGLTVFIALGAVGALLLVADRVLRGLGEGLRAVSLKLVLTESRPRLPRWPRSPTEWSRTGSCFRWVCWPGCGTADAAA